MADATDWATAAGGIPLGIIQGYNYGQKAQREEEKALADIEAARLRNELLGYTSKEYMDPNRAATRTAEDDLRRAIASLGGLQTGAQIEATTAERPALVSGLGANIRAASTAAGTAEKRASLEDELFKGRADIVRALATQDTELLPGTLALRESRQREQQGQVDSALRQWTELATRSGTVDTIRAAVANNPNAPLYDQLFTAFQSAPPNQKGLIAERMVIADQQDLQRIGGVADADAWLQRPGRQTKSRAWIDNNQLVVAPMVIDPATNQPALDVSKAQRFATWEEFKRQYGTAIPRGTPPAREQKPAAPNAADFLRSVASGTGAPAAGAAPAAPAAGAAPAPATAGGMPLPALRAPASPQAGPQSSLGPAIAAAGSAPPAAAAAAPAAQAQTMFFQSAPLSTIREAANRGIPGALQELERRLSAARQTEEALGNIIMQQGVIPGA